MLLRITHRCRMSCNHCMIDAGPEGQHMTMDTFEQALRFIRVVNPMVVLVSGGEPTDHPGFFIMIGRLKQAWATAPEQILVATNGMNFADQPFLQACLRLRVNFQVTNDPRFYPQKVLPIHHRDITYVDHIGDHIFPMGRAATNQIPTTRKSPPCYNLRSLVRGEGLDIKTAIHVLDGYMRWCTPSINIDGTISAGESNHCAVIGDVSMNLAQITDNMKSMHCNKCGLCNNLLPAQAARIGE